MKHLPPQLVQEVLDEYIPEIPTPLHHLSPYTLLIAVLLSAQCTDQRVNSVTPHLFVKAATPEDMILCSPEEIAKIIAPCGLAKRKTTAICHLSHQLIERHKGQVPNDFSSLIALTGVGEKTAAVLLCQAFQRPAFPVDCHIHRSARRWGLSLGTTPAEVSADLKSLFPQHSWCCLHLQMISFARLHCRARAHIPKDCPMCSLITRELDF